MKRVRPGLAIAGCLLVGFVAHAQSLPPEVSRKVDQVFAVYDKARSPGCTLGVIQDGSFAYRKGYGAGSVELGVPLSSQSVIYMASASKQFTAASVVLAAEQGYLSLDDDVHKYIAELPDYGQPITLREMLHHTSGLRDYFSLLSLSGRNPLDVLSTADMLELVSRQKALNFTPGAEFLYSNTNYLLLAEVIKRATKMPLSEFTAKNIFEPLGMTHTRFYDDHTVVVPGRVPAYDPGKNGSFVVDWSTNFDLVGDGGLISTVDDLLLWDRNFYENHLGKGTLLKEMQTVGILNNGKRTNYALGLEMGSYRGLSIVEHGGALFGYRTEILRFPNQRFSVVCLCNVSSADPSNLSRRVADIFLAKDFKASGPAPAKAPAKGSAVPMTAEQRAEIAGMYWNREGAISLRMLARDGGLQMEIGTDDDKSTVALRPYAPGHFHPAALPPGVDVDIQYIAAEGSKPSRMEVTNGGGNPTVFERVIPFDPSSAQLVEYAGAFVSEEIDPVFRIDLQDGKLTLDRVKRAPETLRPMTQDVFVGATGTIRFTRDANGKISGFMLDGGRIQNFRFTRKAE